MLLDKRSRSQPGDAANPGRHQLEHFTHRASKSQCTLHVSKLQSLVAQISPLLLPETRPSSTEVLPARSRSTSKPPSFYDSNRYLGAEPSECTADLASTGLVSVILRLTVTGVSFGERLEANSNTSQLSGPRILPRSHVNRPYISFDRIPKSAAAFWPIPAFSLRLLLPLNTQDCDQTTLT